LFKKLIILFLCSALALVSGCVSDSSVNSQESQSSIQSSISPIDDSKVIQLNVILGSNFSGTSDEKYLDTWVEYLKEEFKLELEINDEYDRFKYYDGTFMKSALAFDSAKGLVYLPSTSEGSLYDLVSTGDILPLKSILESNDNWNALPDEMKKMYEFEGDIWAIPTELTYAVYARRVNKSWLDNVDLKKPENLDELYEMCKAFTYDDPNADVEANTIGAWLYAPCVMDIFNVFDCRLQIVNNGRQVTSIAYNDTSGKFEDCILKPGMTEALEYLQSMVSEGISTNASDKAFGTYASFQEGFTHDIGNKVQSWEGWLDASREKNDELLKKYTGYEYVFNLNNQPTNPVFYNYSGGFYVADDNMQNPEESINRFIDVFFGNQEAYYTGIMGVDYMNSTYTNNSLSANGVPPVIGRIPGLYDEKYDDISNIFGENVEQARRELSAQLQDYVDSGTGYELYPRIGYGVYEKTLYNTLSNYGTSQMIKGNPLLGLFESIYYEVIHSHVSIEEALARYNSEAKKAGIDEYMQEINEKIGK